VRRRGDVNPRAYADPGARLHLVHDGMSPDRCSRRAVQRRLDGSGGTTGLPVVGYTAQNVEKRHAPAVGLLNAGELRRGHMFRVGQVIQAVTKRLKVHTGPARTTRRRASASGPLRTRYSVWRLSVLWASDR
jgi:hypothetical protein